MFKSPPRMSSGSGSPGLLLFMIPLALAAPAGSLQAGAPDAELSATSPDGAPSEERVARELARLDDRLGLETFADGSGLWTARLAAALELRLRTTGAPLHDLMRRLATQLRALGVERPLVGLPEGPEEAGEPPGPKRAEHLRGILATVRLLHEKLDRLERPDPEGAGPSTLAAPGNDDCSAATSIGEGTFTGSTAEATADGSSTCGNTASSPSVWFRYTAAEAGQVTFDTFGSSFDTVLSVHTGCPAEGRDVELACDDDSGGTLQSGVTLGLASGEQVWIRLSGSSGASGSFGLNVEQFQGLAGTITREDTGEAVSGATVSLFDDFGFLVDDRLTRADGGYTFDGLTDGTYFVQAEAEGLIGELYEDFPCHSFTFCNPTFDGTDINLSGAATGIDLALQPGNTISGTVTDAATGEPVSAFVELYSETGGFLDSVAADPDGSYELSGLPDSTYHILAGSSSHRDEIYDDLGCEGWCNVTAGTLLEVSSGATLSGIDFALERLGAISGTVVAEATGEPLSGQRVDVFTSDGSFWRSGFTDGSGAYEIGSLDAGEHFVRASGFEFRDELYDEIPCAPGCDVTNGTPVPVVLDTTTTGIDFTLLRLAAIRGTVTHTVTGDPITHVRVRAVEASGFFRQSAFTGSDGTYVLDRLADGSYSVFTESDAHRDEVYDDVPCSGACDPFAGTPVTAEAGTTTSGIDFALDRLGRILGRVVTESDNSVSSSVVALDTSGTPIRSDRSSSGGGGYAIVGLPPGTYFVKTSFFDFSDFGLQDELYDNVPCEPSCDLSEGIAFSVVLNGSVLGVDFALSPCPAQSFVELQTTLYLSTHTEEACERLSAGTDTTVASGADVTFKAGRSVVLEDGFSVQSGAAFRAVIEPEWTHD